MHLARVLTHGLQEAYWISDADLKKDPNTEIDLLTRAVEHVYDECKRHGRRTPKHLNIRGDNTSRELKNQYALSWGVWLIALGNFTSITFNFQVRGHSHSGIGVPHISVRQTQTIRGPSKFMWL
jgi:hypothetical protein